MISLGIWSLIVLWAFQLGIVWDPKTEYWILGVLVAIVWVGVRLPPDPFKGSLLLMPIALSFLPSLVFPGNSPHLGPLIYGILIAITGSVQSGVLSVLLFFIAGMVLLWTVNEKRGMEEKQKPII